MTLTNEHKQRIIKETAKLLQEPLKGRSRAKLEQTIFARSNLKGLSASDKKLANAYIKESFTHLSGLYQKELNSLGS